MKRDFSLFHDLQKHGDQALAVAGLNSGFALNLNPFIAKVSDRFGDPFPVFIVELSDLRSITQRFVQIMAANGLSITDDQSEDDLTAMRILISEDRMKATVPARRFGVEIHNDGEQTGLLFEAVKTGDPDRLLQVPSSATECAGKTLGDCKYFEVYYLFRGSSKSDPERQIYLDCWKFLFSNEKTLETGSLWGETTEIATDAFSLAKIPDTLRGRKNVLGKDLFETKPDDGRAYSKYVGNLIDGIQSFLWVLEREPTLVSRISNAFPDQNRLRRLRKRSPYSCIHTISIDQSVLRRLEFQRASEIADAIARKGGYTVPGLVLVGEHKRPTTQKTVLAYARCADEVVRHEATSLLRSKNYAGLAELVRDFGALRTRQTFEVSHAYVTRLVPG